MRAFLAIDLPEDVQAEIAALQTLLRPGRKVPEENLHLTLAFLDEQPSAVLQELHERLNAFEFAPFTLRVAGLEMFGGKHPRLLYLKADPTPELMALRRALRSIAREVGIDLPRERFRPHVTLARFRRDMLEEQIAQIGAFMAACGDWGMPPFEVNRYCLFGSTLHPDGAVHEVLAEYFTGEEI